MATLTLQVRLGISRGWRVRTLNNAKFYNQAVAHCLFIFSSLRARGYKDRIWTMNYTVFATGVKYSIYVEYFLLPLHTSWKRGIQRYFCSAFTFNQSKMSGWVRPGFGFSLVLKGTPHLRRVAHIRRSSRKKSATATSSAIWAWSARTRMLDVIYREFRTSRDHIALFHNTLGWASGVAVDLASPDSIPAAEPFFAAGDLEVLVDGANRIFRDFRAMRPQPQRLREGLLRLRRKKLRYFGQDISLTLSKLALSFPSRVVRSFTKHGMRGSKRAAIRLNRSLRLGMARFLFATSARRLLWARRVFDKRVAVSLRSTVDYLDRVYDTTAPDRLRAWTNAKKRSALLRAAGARPALRKKTSLR